MRKEQITIVRKYVYQFTSDVPINGCQKCPMRDIDYGECDLLNDACNYSKCPLILVN